MILVDTSVWIQFFKGEETWQANHLDWLLSNRVIITADLILSEIYRGLQSDKQHRLVELMLDELSCVTLGGKEIVMKSLKWNQKLLKKGLQVHRTIDLLIATWCIENEVELLHADPVFDRMAEVIPLMVTRRDGPGPEQG